MKKLFVLTIAAVAMSIGANAQSFSKGDWTLNAQLSGLELNHEFADGVSNTRLNIAANAGYFISDRFAVDATLGLGYAKAKDVDGTSNFNFGAGVRYYPVTNLFARVGYDGVTAKDQDLASNLRVSVGYDLFLSEKVYFEPSVYYAKNLADHGANNVGLALGIGVKF